MDRNFAKIAFWDDPVERDGPEQMACDEVLLESARIATLRVFRWKGPWISAGYFCDREQAEGARPRIAFCRRWTGGGVVVHEGDFTFALVAPRGEALASMRPSESYQRIHLALAEALRSQGIEADLSQAQGPALGDCFAGAVKHDVMAGATKIAGGAQRRTRHGLLHQGSVQCAANLGPGFALALARTLAAFVEIWTPPSGLEEKVESLARKKYASPEFLRGPRAPKPFTADAMS